MTAALTPNAPLCPCGIRGCDLYKQHRAAFIDPVPTWRRMRPARKRHNRNR